MWLFTVAAFARTRVAHTLASAATLERLVETVRGLIGTVICAVLAIVGCGGDAGTRPIASAQPDLSGTHSPPTESAQHVRQELDGVLSRREAAVVEHPPQFTEVSGQQGIEFTFHTDAVPGRYFLPEIMGGGAAWFDFDRDGWLDLFLVNGDELESKPRQPKPHSDALFQNRGGESFVEISGVAGATTIGYGQGCAVGDFDGDGFEDLYVSGYRTSTLLHNLGDGTFADETLESGTRNDRWGSGVVWLDINDDLLLDLFVVNYLNVTPQNREQCRFSGVPGYCGPGHYEAVDDRLFLNLGDGRFRDVSAEVGVTIPDGKGLGVAVLDFDLDGQNEIYVANDMTPNFLFQRQAAPSSEKDRPAAMNVLPKFRDVAPTAGCAVSDMGLNEASMGVACADFDSNEYCDIFLTHFYAQKNTLYRNLGGLQFEDDSRRARLVAISHDRLGFGTVAFDYDRDGAMDLLIANGHVLGPEHKPFAMLPQIMRNDGQARFEDVGPQSGDYFRQLSVGRGAAGSDFDNDGDLDMLVTHLDRPAALLRNDTITPHHFLGIELRRADRLPAQGTQVIIEAGVRRITSMSIGGGSYLCVSDPRLLVGLKDWSEPVTLEIRWQSGTVARYENVAVDRYWLAMEGRELLPSFPGASPP